MNQSPPLVSHWVIEAFDVDPPLINNKDRFIKLAHTFISYLKLTKVATRSHYFGPGLSVVVILAESHISFHTWPEYEYIYSDVITCSRERKLTREELGEAFARVFHSGRLAIRNTSPE